MPEIALSSYESGWTIVGLMIGLPALCCGIFYVVVQTIFWALEKGIRYNQEDADFIGVGPMIGLNLLVPGSGLMAGGQVSQGWVNFALWVSVFFVGMRYSTLLSRNLTIVHLFSGVWSAFFAAREISLVSLKKAENKRQSLKKVNLQRQKVPTLEDPDHFVLQLKLFQMLLEAAADSLGRFDSIQSASANRLKSLLKVEDRTYGRLLEQLRVQGNAQRTLGEGDLLTPDQAFDKILPTVVDHPAFEKIRIPVLQTAATLLGIPAKEAAQRRLAYEEGDSVSLENARPTPKGALAISEASPLSSIQKKLEAEQKAPPTRPAVKPVAYPGKTKRTIAPNWDDEAPPSRESIRSSQSSPRLTQKVARTSSRSFESDQIVDDSDSFHEDITVADFKVPLDD